MKINSFQPFFLVGCSRSGTTFLQSLLAAHPQITSFNESHFYHFMVPGKYERKRFALSLVSRKLKPHIQKYFEQDLKRQELLKYFPSLPLMRWQSDAFIKTMRYLTQEEGNQVFLEKTPDHIYYISYIIKLVPNAKFIHIVRSGAEVIASLYEATHQYPEPWAGARSLDLCIENWLKAIKITQNYMNEPNHIVVGYQNLVNNPESTLEKLCEFMELNFDRQMLTNYTKASEKLTLEQAGRTVNNEIKNTGLKKFYTVFDEAQQQYVLSQIKKVNLELINQI